MNPIQYLVGGDEELEAEADENALETYEQRK